MNLPVFVLLGVWNKQQMKPVPLAVSQQSRVAITIQAMYCAYNVKLRRDVATTVAVENQ
jgi:hypothetical protein